jgi:hypothetical protein
MAQGKMRFFGSLLSNLSVLIPLIFIGYTPFLYLHREEQIANQIGQYAFYILTLGILWKAIQYLFNEASKKGNRLKGVEAQN